MWFTTVDKSTIGLDNFFVVVPPAVSTLLWTLNYRGASAAAAFYNAGHGQPRGGGYDMGGPSRWRGRGCGLTAAAAYSTTGRAAARGHRFFYIYKYSLFHSHFTPIRTHLHRPYSTLYNFPVSIIQWWFGFNFFKIKLCVLSNYYRPIIFIQLNKNITTIDKIMWFVAVDKSTIGPDNFFLWLWTTFCGCATSHVMELAAEAGA